MKIYISIIIATKDSSQFLQDCLRSIFLHGKNNPFEVIVVDDGSSDDTQHILEEWQRKTKQLKTVVLTKNGGPAHARNIGVSKARGELLFFLDADTELHQNWFEDIVRFFEKHPKAGGAQLNCGTGGHFLSWVGLPFEHRLEKTRSEQAIFGGITAALVIRRSVFEVIGGFDSRYGIYGEDTDLCWRVWLAGCSLHFLDVPVLHHGQSSLLKVSQLYLYGARNHLWSILKNASWWQILWMPGLFTGAWFLIGAWRHFGAVVAGLFQGWLHAPSMLASRLDRVEIGRSQTQKIMFGGEDSLSVRDLFKRLRAWLQAF